MKSSKVIFLSILFASMMTLMSLSTATPANAAVATAAPFPIGIFNSPGFNDTTFAKYKEIKNMNVTYLMTSGLNTFKENDAALTQAAANGLKVIVSDPRLMFNSIPINQISEGGSHAVSNTNAIGQTFTVPAGTSGYIIDTIKLNIDNQNWASDVILTLSIYDNPSKTNLIRSTPMTGPVIDNYPVFYIGSFFSPNTTYYMELTSNSSTPIDWLSAASDVYEGGMAYQNGTADSSFDFCFKMDALESMYNGTSHPSVSDINNIADHYKTNPSLLGYNLIDEPSSNKMTRLQAAAKAFKQRDPNHLSLVNLLPSYATQEQQIGFKNTGIGVVSPSRSVGQTFETSSNTTFISTIQLYVVIENWSNTATITLKLWDSKDKTTLLGQDTLYSSATIYPQFTFNVDVSANTSYYWELSQGGVEENHVGWVVRSPNGFDWEKDGTAYDNGVPVDADYWFTINQNIVAFSYEDYVYQWASKNPDVLMYDHYPFLENGGLSTSYYSDMEIIRRQSLKNKVDFWTYIQSVGITGSLRSPSEGDMRYQVFTSLAYGAKGINYFLYLTPDYPGTPFHDGIINYDLTKTALYDYAANINADVLKLGPKLLGLKSEAVYHTGSTIPTSTTVLPSNYFWKPTDMTQPLVFGYFKDNTGREYMMVVNRDVANSRTVTFDLSTKPSNVIEVSKTTGAEVSTNYNSTTGQLSSTFAAGEGRLYALPSSTPADVSATTLTSTIGTVSTGGTANETITNIPNATTLTAFKAAITPAVNATFEVYDADGITIASTLATGKKVIVTAQNGITKVTYTVTVNAAPSSGGGGGSTTPSDEKVTSNNGNLTLPAGKTGEVSWKDAITISIPAGATDKELKLTIESVLDTQKLLTNKEVLASPVFEILKNFSENFSKPVTLTFSYNPASLKNNQIPVVFYYDEAKKEWVEVVGGKVNGNHITVEVNHFTKYAVFAVNQVTDVPAIDQPTDTPAKVQFSDIAGHWAESSIMQAVSGGIVKGYTDGTFKPGKTVTRAEFVVMLMNALKPQEAGAELTFTDSAKIGAWAQNAVAQAFQAGIIKGYKDGSFRPDAEITRAEMAVMIANALGQSIDVNAATGFADDKDIPVWAKGAVAIMKKLDLVVGKGKNEFDPNDKTTRAEAVTVLLKVLAQKSE
ncbi:hypothetical protein FHS14_004132 [Paenibacillus baekrokdamisoli]|nr:S-layer homology domain-containing protein [Paenibacillus baekrokdamisoli]MBB3071125.1 hypothetical protein [Paenibacillus baekrokdamisoli]